jgi:CRAL/TRIO domain
MSQLQSTLDAQRQQCLERQIVKGPTRFGPITHETFSSFRTLSSIMNLSTKERFTLASIQAQLDTMPEKEEIRKKLTRAQTLRIAHFCSFDVDRSLKVMCRVKSRHLELRAATLKDQLATKTIFPCPGLETRDGSKVFMMRPSRYVPHETPVSDIIDNLIFVMDRMTQQDFVTDQKGVAFVANMDSWKMRNFSTDYCLRFMMALQGHVFPARVNLFLIVNPPSWFGKVSLGPRRESY